MRELSKLWDHLSSIKAPPVNVLSIAKLFGIRVYRVPNWEDGLSGMIKMSEEDGGSSGYAIYVNAEHSEKRRRFTVAHEVAHFVLHKNLIGDGVVDDGLYRSGLSNLIEMEANNLAARILIPGVLLRKFLNDEENYSVEKLSEKFNVSPQAMAIRLRVAEIN